MTQDFNAAVIAEFRANAGRVGSMFAGARLLLLTTTGARSGRPHTVPLGALPDGDRTLVIASAMGADRHPAWFHNVLADPEVTVESGAFTMTARAEVIEGAERDRLFDRAVEADPGWADYQARTARTIPVVGLTPLGTAPAASLGGGAFLTAIHDGIRHELGLVRAELAASGPGALGAQLRVNCLSLCEGVHAHHTGEDEGMFPGMRAARPDLAPALDELTAQHAVVAGLVDELRKRVSDPGADPAVLLPDVDRIIGELNAHFDLEERRLCAALDGL